MTRKKIIDIEIEKAIINLLYKEDRYMSISKITKKLEEDYDIKRSPQVIKRHLLLLQDKGKIMEKENGKKKI